MKLLMERANSLAQARVSAVLDGLAAAAADELPEDVIATREENAIVLRGRRLRWRSIADARLRGFAGWLR